MSKSAITASAVVLLFAVTTAPAALIPVVEYSMYDGYAGNGWYNDNGYTGTNVGGYLSGGTGQLTDGSKGNPIQSGYAYSQPYLFWAGFNPEIIFDLGTPQAVGAINTYFLIHNPSATYLPDHVDIAFSLDGVTWGPTLTRTFTLSEQYPDPPYNVAEVNYEILPAPQFGRYAKLTYVREPSHSWMAMDEVEFTSLAPEPTTPLVLTTVAMACLPRRRRVR